MLVFHVEPNVKKPSPRYHYFTLNKAVPLTSLNRPMGDLVGRQPYAPAGFTPRNFPGTHF
jgi:hypothetical protein